MSQQITIEIVDSGETITVVVNEAARGAGISFATNKATIVDADKVAILDSAATDAPKHSLFSLIKSTLKTYFDTLYQATGLAALKDNNLSDLESASTARTNLGLGTAATTAATDYVAVTGSQTVAGAKTFTSTLAVSGLAANITTDGALSRIQSRGTFRFSDGDQTLSLYASSMGGISRAITFPHRDGNVALTTGETHTNPTINDYTEGVVAIGNSGASKTISLAAGTFQTVTLTANCTFTMPAATAGKSFILKVLTGAGGYAATFTGVKWSGGTAPTITMTASKYDLVSFVADGTEWSGSILPNFTA